MSRRSVVIHYRRPPDRVQCFEQIVVLETPAYTITYLPGARLERPVRAGGRVILDAGAPVVWFTYPGRWHDIGRFHLADGEFTGYYANLLTPVVMEEGCWETTDLFLDVWAPARGRPELLDRDELEEAEGRGWVDAETALHVREEAAELLAHAADGSWPPREVREWTLERVRERLGYSDGETTAAETSRLRSR